ncbi:hypothetical protein Ccrd_025657 [Cynara cardunculus var. scolymus]|uniref:Heparan-alpha-glucosaminide N-acetyltransferase catalytic domain-containing protein n=1 Tax=Cynara cardunculus var. scolymus TaxID=59895 RepID=A0A118JA57_CYNCS|nr:hypothetical protein Ccrd_025657 [Cynara cardunculus var. scolymus]
MADIKLNDGDRCLDIADTPAPTSEEPHVNTTTEKMKKKRVASVDIFRGFTVALMILVDDAGGEWPMIAHAPWNGCNLADFVMPFFLFIVGMSIALALKYSCIVIGGFSHAPDKLSYGVDMKNIRWCGILQRIALAYFVVGLLEIATQRTHAEELPPGCLSIYKLYIWHWILGACVIIVYLAVIYGTYVPNWQFTVHNTDSADYGKILTVACDVRGKLDPPCNAVGYIDRQVLGINHMYPHPAWKRSKGHSSRLRHWIMMGLGLVVLGIVLHFTDAIPLNKQLYTFSYVCVTSGAAALVFSFFYIMVDIWTLRYLFLPLEWIGKNAMLVYVMAAEGIFAGFIYWIQKHIFFGVWHSRRVGILLYVIFAEIMFWVIISGILDWLGIYWKL